MIYTAGTFVPAPQGSHQAVLVDIVELGLMDDNFGGEKYFVRYMFQLDEKMENGKPFVVGQKFNATLHERGKLRPFIEALRGKAFTKEELKSFDDEQLIGTNVQLNIVHKEGNNGNTYANIAGVAPWNKKFGSEIKPSEDYVRAKDKAETFNQDEDGGRF